MSDEKSNDESTDMADEIIESVTSEDEQSEDALTKRERTIEKDKEAERIQKARELKKQLRKRDLGLLRYRWPAVILIVAGILSILTEFLQVMEHPPGVGFTSFFEFTMENLAEGRINYVVFFIFPLTAGIIMIVSALISYYNPKGPYISIIPAMMMVMAGAFVYYLVDFAIIANPDVQISVTAVPMAMVIFGVVALLSIGIREKE
jgi:VIT1/CCC1 family predicted Fe2+/Mn2+ transporter